MANVNDIMNEIDRIEGAKGDLAGAIEEKGVEVPEGAKIEEYPGLVRQIQQGGTSDCVKFTPQTLSASEQEQARTNIGAAGTKIGVISQTQTWSGTGSNPRTYVMSVLVTGLIPQANIDLFEAAGATFNESTGYFELNGLTDISYEEMQVIYGCTIGLIPNINRDRALAGNTTPTIRTTLPMRGVSSFASSIQYFAYGNNYLEQIVLNPMLYNSAQNNGTGAFQNCYCLKSIFGKLRLHSTTNDASIFLNCYSLENVSIEFLRGSLTLARSSPLSLASVVYMVENAANTSAITITLHATAYARCQADTTQYTYGGNTYTGIIALATAKNITIASA